MDNQQDDDTLSRPPRLLFSTEKGQVSGTGAQGGQCPGLEGDLGPPLRAQEK